MATKVLVFESDAAFAGELRSELSNLGCTIDVVDDGNLGLQKASADKPDLILLSIELPRMNGFSVCNKLKKDSGLKDIPLIIMSSESSEETFEQHRKLRTRAEDYVHKPIAFGELLRHIQNFVQLEGGSPASEGIVIDDDIAIEEDDAPPQVPQAPPLPRKIAPPSSPPKEIDPDMAAFADDAFGRLQGANGTAGDATPEPAQVQQSSRKSSMPPKPTQGEVDRAKARIVELEAELQSARDDATKLHGDFDRRIEEEQRKMDQQMEELRAKFAQAGKTGGVSSREFLDLREALNKKDKEILALKESLGKKDKEIIEARDRSLSLERKLADLEDKIIATEREIEESKEKMESLVRDKDVAKKASEDFKSRFEKRGIEIEAKSKELEDARAKAKEDLAALETAMAAALAAAKAHEEQALAEAREAFEREKAEAVAAREKELTSEHGSQLAALHRAQQEELAKLRAQLEGEKEAALEDARTRAAGALAAREAELEETRASHVAQTERDRDEKVGAALAERDAHVAAANQQRESQVAAAIADRDEQVAAANQQRESQVAATIAERDERVAATERDRDAKIAALESDRDQRIATIEGDRDAKIAALESDRDQRIAAIEAKAASDLDQTRAAAAAQKAASGQQIQELQLELAATKDALAALDAAKKENDAKNEREIQDLDSKLVETAKARADLATDMEHARQQIERLEADLAGTKAALQDTREKLEAETARADRAFTKWEQDRSSLDKAKDALAVALSQIEEAEGRPIR